MRNSAIRIAIGMGVAAQLLFAPVLFSTTAWAQGGATAGGRNNNTLQPSGLIQNRGDATSDSNAGGTSNGLTDALQEKTDSTYRKVPATGSRTTGRTSTGPRIQKHNSLSDRTATNIEAVGNSTWSRTNVKISVDYPGGTIGEYVDAVKKEADSLNLIVTESAKELKLPKIALKNVPVHVAIKCIEQCFDPNKTIVRVGGEIEGVQFIQAEIVSTNQVEVINIRHLISGTKNDKEKENFLAAVETGLQMQSETTKNLKIKFHEETGLLFLSGDRSEISLVQQIVSELSPKYVGGMPGAAGGMMGSGGYGMSGSSGGGMMPGSMGGGAMSGGRGRAMDSGFGGAGMSGSGRSGAMMPGGGGSGGVSGGGSGGGGLPGFGGGSGPVRRGNESGIGGGRFDRSGSFDSGDSTLPRSNSSRKSSKGINRGGSGGGSDDHQGGSGAGFPRTGSTSGGGDSSSFGGSGSDFGIDESSAGGSTKTAPRQRTSPKNRTGSGPGSDTLPPPNTKKKPQAGGGAGSFGSVGLDEGDRAVEYDKNKSSEKADKLPNDDPFGN